MDREFSNGLILQLQNGNLRNKKSFDGLNEIISTKYKTDVSGVDIPYQVARSTTETSQVNR